MVIFNSFCNLYLFILQIFLLLVQKQKNMIHNACLKHSCCIPSPIWLLRAQKLAYPFNCHLCILLDTGTTTCMASLPSHTCKQPNIDACNHNSTVLCRPWMPLATLTTMETTHHWHGSSPTYLDSADQQHQSIWLDLTWQCLTPAVTSLISSS